MENIEKPLYLKNNIHVKYVYDIDNCYNNETLKNLLGVFPRKINLSHRFNISTPILILRKGINKFEIDVFRHYISLFIKYKENYKCLILDGNTEMGEKENALYLEKVLKCNNVKGFILNSITFNKIKNKINNNVLNINDSVYFLNKKSTQSNIINNFKINCINHCNDSTNLINFCKIDYIDEINNKGSFNFISHNDWKEYKGKHLHREYIQLWDEKKIILYDSKNNKYFYIENTSFYSFNINDNTNVTNKLHYNDSINGKGYFEEINQVIWKEYKNGNFVTEYYRLWYFDENIIFLYSFKLKLYLKIIKNKVYIVKKNTNIYSQESSILINLTNHNNFKYHKLNYTNHKFFDLKKNNVSIIFNNQKIYFHYYRQWKFNNEIYFTLYKNKESVVLKNNNNDIIKIFWDKISINNNIYCSIINYNN
jgi:hypothetical protein